MLSEEAIPHAHDEVGTALGHDRIVGLTELDAEVLMDFVERQPTLRELAQKRGLSILDFLAWWHSPPIAVALDALLRFHAFRRDLRDAQLREELVAILAQVAKTSPNPIEQRRAATTALRATDRRSAVAYYAAYRPYRSSRRYPRAVGAGGPEDTHTTNDHDAPSRPRGSDLRGRRGPASHVSPSQPAQPRVHSAHSVLPNHNGAFKVEDPPWRRGAAPIDTAFTTPLVSLSRSVAASESAPIGDICGSPLPSTPGHLDTSTPSADTSTSSYPADAADDDLDDDPEGTLAIAHHVLEAVKSDPGAYPPEAIRAAHVYIQLAAHPDKLADPHSVPSLAAGESAWRPESSAFAPSPAAPDTS